MVPLFLIAPMNRSGAHYLREILLCHDAIKRTFCPEDYFLAYTDELSAYVHNMAKHWGAKHEMSRDRLMATLSDTIFRFFGNDIGDCRYLLLTTPRPWGLRNVFSLFPDAKVLILVCDGRNTVASACKSFQYGSFNHWARQWQQGAKELLKFSREYDTRRGVGWEMVRYEDLSEQPENLVRLLLQFLDLDLDGFNWESFSKMPLLGSSEHGIGTAVESPAHFKNNDRYRSWSAFQRCKFHLLAGSANKQLQNLAANGKMLNTLKSSLA